MWLDDDVSAIDQRIWLSYKRICTDMDTLYSSGCVTYIGALIPCWCDLHKRLKLCMENTMNQPLLWHITAEMHATANNGHMEPSGPHCEVAQTKRHAGSRVATINGASLDHNNWQSIDSDNGELTWVIEGYGWAMNTEPNSCFYGQLCCALIYNVITCY